MKRFRFSLETLLKLRKEKEQECEIVLARAAGELSVVRRRIDEAVEAGERAFQEQWTSLDDLRSRELVLLKSMNDRKKLEKPLQEASRKVDEARVVYTKAHAQRSALDKLRDKRKDQWKTHAKLEEIKRLDETSKGTEARRRLRGGEG